MKHLKYRFSSRSAVLGFVLAGAGAVGLAVGCSSSTNDEPSGPPVVNTGGGGSGGRGDSSAGDDEGGANPVGGRGGSSNGGAAGEAGEAGEAGTGAQPAGGSGPLPANCPTSDVGFYNQTSTSQKSVFDDVKRLGAHATLPPLPGS